MNILITGATGFIGSYLVRALVKEGYHCICLVRDLKKAKILFGDFSDIEFVVADITNRDILVDYNEPVDCVINVVGLLATWNSSEEELESINSKAPVNLIQNLTKNKIKHFIHISAGGVAGPVDSGLTDENYNCKPATLYEKTKYLGELNVKEFCAKNRIPYTIIRPTFTYGPGDRHKLLLFKMVNKGLIIICGSGNSVNHPVYIDDLIKGIILAVKKVGSNQIYLIGGERPVTKKEFLETIARILNKKAISINIPKWFTYLIAYIMEFLSRIFKINPILSLSRANMLCKNFGYDISKAKKELNYDPRYNLERGLEKTIEYYKRKNLI